MVAAAKAWCIEAYARARWKRALRMLLEDRSLTRISAAKEYGEWNLDATVADLKRRRLQLRMLPELSLAAFGPVVLHPRLVRGYTLRPESRALAAQLLASVDDRASAL
jgi:hypothetical protein